MTGRASVGYRFKRYPKMFWDSFVTSNEKGGTVMAESRKKILEKMAREAPPPKELEPTTPEPKEEPKEKQKKQE